jgi:hypothetical protein
LFLFPFARYTAGVTVKITLFFFAARKKKQRGGDEREQDPHNKSASVTSQSEQDVATHTWECALPIIYQDFGLSHE